MYALSYKNRDDGGELYGALYTGLIACSLRFDHTLLGDPQLNAEYEVKKQITHFHFDQWQTDELHEK